MADNNKQGGTSVAEQVANEIRKAKKDSLKTKLKTLFMKYDEANEVLTGITQEITELLAASGEKEADIVALLRG